MIGRPIQLFRGQQGVPLVAHSLHDHAKGSLAESKHGAAPAHCSPKLARECRHQRSAGAKPELGLQFERILDVHEQKGVRCIRPAEARRECLQQLFEWSGLPLSRLRQDFRVAAQRKYSVGSMP